MKAYKTVKGVTQYKPSFKALQQIMEGDTNEGFCLACGARAHGIEPDARRYTCDACQAPKVYGAEELLLMGLTY